MAEKIEKQLAEGIELSEGVIVYDNDDDVRDKTHTNNYSQHIATN